MKRASFIIFIIFILLHIEAQAQSYSILTGIVTEFHRRGLVVKSDEGGVVQLRVGRRTVYPKSNSRFYPNSFVSMIVLI